LNVPASGFTGRPVIRHPDAVAGRDDVAVEEPLEIRIDGAPLAITMRTPGHDAELAAGFCLTEGIVEVADDLERVEPCRQAEYGNLVLVELSDEAKVSRQSQISAARREFYLSSSCGLCGTRTIEAIAKKVLPLRGEFLLERHILDSLPARMAQAQESFSRTGGLHAAALFDPLGDLRLLREDVGRHNAVDKVVGALLLSGQVPAGPGVLLVSGRASFELVQKAARAGVAALAAVGAPSSMAIDAAQRFGMTLIGFLREGRFNVYCGRERVKE